MTFRDAARRVGHTKPRHRVRALIAATCAVVALNVAWFGYLVIDLLTALDADTSPTPIEVLRAGLTAALGAAAAAALVFAHGSRCDNEENGFDVRFRAAATQLGDLSPAVRIAGVYAMASAADEATSPEQRQQCVDVLCGYLRLPFNPPSALTSDPGTGTEPSDRAVRDTLLTVITSHLRRSARINWGDCTFDFTGVVFPHADFDDIHFRAAVTFREAEIVDGAFTSVRFDTDTSFHKATCQNIRFSECDFRGPTDFMHAHFAASARFQRSHFRGEINFLFARFDGTAYFDASTFTGRTTLWESKLNGYTLFENVRFLGKTEFVSAHFAGTTRFLLCSFAGETIFNGAKFTGPTEFLAPRAWNATTTQFDWHGNHRKIPGVISPQPPRWPPPVHRL